MNMRSRSTALAACLFLTAGSANASLALTTNLKHVAIHSDGLNGRVLRVRCVLRLVNGVLTVDEGSGAQRFSLIVSDPALRNAMVSQLAADATDPGASQWWVEATVRLTQTAKAPQLELIGFQTLGVRS
jgi:hypothetical protein